jgi:formylglycine-generating enzyme required for sulfatase activity
MLTAFLSYSRRDIQEAQRLQRSLESAGVRCWHDETWLTPGEDFALEITRGIRESEVFILLLSKASNESDFVRREVAIAHHFGRPVLPFALDDVELSDGLLPYLIRLHVWNSREHTVVDFSKFVMQQFVTNRSKPQGKGTPSNTPGAVVPGTVSEVSEPLVTNQKYAEFAKRTGRPVLSSQAAENPDAPIRWVSWDDALAYCDWASGRLPWSLESPRACSQTPAGTEPELGEWYDSGIENFKQVRGTAHSCLLTLVERGSRLPSVSFRCISVTRDLTNARIPIAGGEHTVGTDPGHFTPLAQIYRVPLHLRRLILNRTRQKRRLQSFTISAHCVTNDQYFKFTQAAHQAWPDYWKSSWLERTGRPFPARLATQPVVNITPEKARNYCTWAGGRLPEWAEWERAASGPLGWIYPWGNIYDRRCCNSLESERGSIAAVTEFSSGDSPEGVRQLSGNVGEWVVGPGGEFEIRGGSYQMPCEVWGCASAFQKSPAGVILPDVGFRVVF